MNTNKHSKKVVHLPKFIQKNHTAILFSLLLFLMLPVTFVHAQRLYTTDGVNVRAKPNSSSKVLTSVSAGTVPETGGLRTPQGHRHRKRQPDRKSVV